MISCVTKEDDKWNEWKILLISKMLKMYGRKNQSLFWCAQESKKELYDCQLLAKDQYNQVILVSAWLLGKKEEIMNKLS